MIIIIIFYQQLKKLNYKTLIKKIFITFFFLTIIFSCNLFEIDPKQKNMTITMSSHQTSRQYRKKIVFIGREDDALLENGRLRHLSTNNDDTW